MITTDDPGMIKFSQNIIVPMYNSSNFGAKDVYWDNNNYLLYLRKIGITDIIRITVI